jgi:hypothetical protein
MHHNGCMLKGERDPRWRYVRGCGCRMCSAHEGEELERRVRSKSRPWFRRWCVTVMDCWTPTRVFWTQAGAAKFRKEHSQCAYLYQWQRDRWVLVEGAF